MKSLMANFAANFGEVISSTLAVTLIDFGILKDSRFFGLPDMGIFFQPS